MASPALLVSASVEAPRSVDVGGDGVRVGVGGEKSTSAMAERTCTWEMAARRLALASEFLLSLADLLSRCHDWRDDNRNHQWQSKSQWPWSEK